MASDSGGFEEIARSMRTHLLSPARIDAKPPPHFRYTPPAKLRTPTSSTPKGIQQKNERRKSTPGSLRGGNPPKQRAQLSISTQVSWSSDY